MKIKQFLVGSTLLFSGIDFSYAMKGGDFSTLEACVATIRAASGHELEIIIDKPSKVSGFFKVNGKNKLWACVREESGTKGIYYNGYFDNE